MTESLMLDLLNTSMAWNIAIVYGYDKKSQVRHTKHIHGMEQSSGLWI